MDHHHHLRHHDSGDDDDDFCYDSNDDVEEQNNKPARPGTLLIKLDSHDDTEATQDTEQHQQQQQFPHHPTIMAPDKTIVVCIDDHDHDDDDVDDGKKQSPSLPRTRMWRRILCFCCASVFVLLIVLLVVTLRDKESREAPADEDDDKNNPNLQIQNWQPVGASMDGGTLSFDFLGVSLAMSANGQIVVAGAPHATTTTASSSGRQQYGVGQVVAMQWYNSSQEWRPMMKRSNSSSDDEAAAAAAAAALTGSSVNDFFGSAVALSANGWTLAAGAVGGDGLGGDNEEDNEDEVEDAGYVRVFDWQNATQTWKQNGQNLTGKQAKDGFGNAVALSAAGDVLAVGATSSSDKQGYVQVYHRKNTTMNGMWTTMGQELMGTSAGDEYGKAVALSEDGRRLAVGASQQQTSRIGLVQVYEYDETTDQWGQLGQDLLGYDKDHWFGETLDLSADGNALAVGERGGSNNIGHVRVFVWNATASTWVRKGQTLKGERYRDSFGCSVALSSDGETLVVGGSGNDGEGNGTISTENAGHVRVFAWDRKKLIWHQVGPDIDGEASTDSLGSTVAMSADGRMIAAGGPMKNGFSGHVRVFRALF